MNYKDRIDDRVAALLSRHAADESPIDVKKMAERDGIRVLFDELDDDISGFLLKNGQEVFIVVNDTHHPNRQRFTIAHEYGHHQLHLDERDIFIDKTKAYFRNTDSATGEEKQEVEANYFAASILMPEELVEKELEKLPDDLSDMDLFRLANKFGVSQMAMEIRLQNLGLVSFVRD